MNKERRDVSTAGERTNKGQRLSVRYIGEPRK